MTAFTAELAAALHRDDRRLSVDVSPKTYDSLTHPRSAFFDYRELARAADWVWIMGWGLHWSTSAPGPVAPLGWLERVAAYAAALPHRDRFILGTSLYGMDWPAGSGFQRPGRPLGYAEVVALAARHGVTPTLDATSGELTFRYRADDGNGHEVWFPDGAAIQRRFAVAATQALGGIGIWRLGQEDQALWSGAALGGAW
jgi:spore germination protein YaaH